MTFDWLDGRLNGMEDPVQKEGHGFNPLYGRFLITFLYK